MNAIHQKRKGRENEDGVREIGRYKNGNIVDALARSGHSQEIYQH